MTGDDGDNVPPEVLGQILEQCCREHLDGTAPFPPEMLNLLCDRFLALADYARSLTRPEKPGIAAAHGVDALLWAMPDLTEVDARKLVARNSRMGVAYDGLKKARQRILNERKKAGQNDP